MAPEADAKHLMNDDETLVDVEVGVMDEVNEQACAEEEFSVSSASLPDEAVDDKETALDSTEQTVTEADQALSFATTCGFVIRIGSAAYRYGAAGYRVESFLTKTIERPGYRGEFRLTQSELVACVWENDEDPPHMWMVSIKDGVNLHKLSLLVDDARNVIDRRISLEDAMVRLEEIDNEPDPFGVTPTSLSFIAVGGGLAMVFGGSWWDILVAAILGGVDFAIVYLAAVFCPRYEWINTWFNVTCSFVVSLIASFIKATARPDLNLTIITLSAVATQLPGYRISLGIVELVLNRIIAGTAHLVEGTVTLFWLALGGWLGVQTVNTLFEFEQVVDPALPVPAVWQAVFVPLLTVTLAIAFQNSYRDFVWSMLCQVLAVSARVLPTWQCFCQLWYLPCLPRHGVATLIAPIH